jgi:UDP-4-amino-4-deoxy-L-arabinose formyltransferase/UDP-glucuronic acid dehydrogenase (UDP-4-keto-hexauronic acid decarboxylating)
MENIYILCTLSSGLDTLNFLNGRLPIKGLISLSKRVADDAISGYIYPDNFCKNLKIDLVTVNSYSLDDKVDRITLSSLKIDILVVLGWQRLVPQWLIDHVSIGVIGVHGSVSGITSGRGRSPQNWALIMGGKDFEVSIFYIDSGIDSGEILATHKFPYTVYDDIKSSHFKVSWATAKMLEYCHSNRSLYLGKGSNQQGIPKYLPQRKPEDGEIDWTRDAEEIHNYVRALTKPYPGSFSFLGNVKLKIWKVRPFWIETELNSLSPGQIIAVMSHGELIVQTGNLPLLIDDYDYDYDSSILNITSGMCFKSGNFKSEISKIISRHSERYINHPISEAIYKLLEEK